jgi:acetyl-CoA carboxylase biotin carboxyl carrier protein
MEFKNIKELINLVSEGNISEVKIQDGEFKILIKGNVAAPIMMTAPQAPVMMTAAPVSAVPVAQVPVASVSVAEKSIPTAEEKPAGNLKEFKSPMVGTFYRSPGVGKPAFVQVGDSVAKGQALCIIEAMKLFNELEADFGGKIVKVLVDDATPVEYDQPLFLLEI